MLLGTMDGLTTQVTKFTDGTSNFAHPLALAATAPATEVFYFKEAMREPDRDKFILAIVKVIEHLNAAEVWEVCSSENWAKQESYQGNLELQMQEAPRWNLPQT